MNDGLLPCSAFAAAPAFDAARGELETHAVRLDVTLRIFVRPSLKGRGACEEARARQRADALSGPFCPASISGMVSLLVSKTVRRGARLQPLVFGGQTRQPLDQRTARSCFIAFGE